MSEAVGGSVKMGRKIRRWAKLYMKGGSVPRSQQGNHKKHKPRIDDEDVLLKCSRWCHEQKRGTVTPEAFMKFVNDKVLPRLRDDDRSSAESDDAGAQVRVQWVGEVVDDHHVSPVCRQTQDRFESVGKPHAVGFTRLASTTSKCVRACTRMAIIGAITVACRCPTFFPQDHVCALQI